MFKVRNDTGIDYSQLRATIKRKNITMSELAKKAGISNSVLARLSKNESVNLSSIAKICQVLCCKITDVVNILVDDVDLWERKKI